MAGYAGIDAQLGFKTETTYGTPVTVDTFAEFDSESLTRQQQFLSSTGLRAGRRSPSIKRHAATTRGVGGNISMKVPTKGFGKWLNLLHGNTVTPAQQAATTAYLQTHNIGTTPTKGKSMTVQVGKPSTNGTVQPFTYQGCKLTSATFSCDLGAELMASLDVDGQDVVTATALATASYPSGVGSFDFTEGTVTVGGSSIGLVSSFSLTCPIPLKTDRYGMAASALKAEPLDNDYLRPTANLALEFTDLAGYNMFANGTEVAVVCDFQGATIASTYKEQFKMTLAACKVVGETPTVGGPDVLSVTTPVEVYDDGTNPPVKIEYQSTDTTL